MRGYTMENLMLPTGKWTIYGNKEGGLLEISSIDSEGNLTATAFGDKITGSFNVSSGEITFTRTPKGSVDTWQLYTGYISMWYGGEDGQGGEIYLLGGSYSNVGVGTVFHRFGWYATPGWKWG